MDYQRRRVHSAHFMICPSDTLPDPQAMIYQSAHGITLETHDQTASHKCHNGDSDVFCLASRSRKNGTISVRIQHGVQVFVPHASLLRLSLVCL